MSIFFCLLICCVLMSIIWKDGHILWDGGHIAHDDNCCCGACEVTSEFCCACADGGKPTSWQAVVTGGSGVAGTYIIDSSEVYAHACNPPGECDVGVYCIWGDDTFGPELCRTDYPMTRAEVQIVWDGIGWARFFMKAIPSPTGQDIEEWVFFDFANTFKIDCTSPITGMYWNGGDGPLACPLTDGTGSTCELTAIF